MSALRLSPAALFVLAAVALFWTSPVPAQESVPAAKGQNQEKGQEKGTGQSQNQAPKAAPKRNQQQPAAPPEASAPNSTPGCGWIGKRVIHSLLRDDAVTAQDYDRIYQTFSCSLQHLRASFDCTVAVGALPTAAEAQTRVDSCWTDPKFDTKAMKIAPATETPSAGAASVPAAQPKSGAPKSAPPAPASTSGSTPNYPEPKAR